MVKKRLKSIKTISRTSEESNTSVKHQDQEDTKTTMYDPLRKKGILDFRYYYLKIRGRIQYSKKFLINMELINGMHDTFYVFPKGESFKYKEGTYVIDDESKYYSVNSSCYCLDYHQSFNLPFKRKFPLNQVRKTIESIDDNEIETAINPSSLRQFIHQKVVEGLMKGQRLSEDLKQIKMIAGIAAFAAVIHLIIFVVKSGMLNSIQSPF